MAEKDKRNNEKLVDFFYLSLHWSIGRKTGIIPRKYARVPKSTPKPDARALHLYQLPTRELQRICIPSYIPDLYRFATHGK